MKVLLAEDDVLNRQLGRTMLENKGYKVVAVENGRLAIEKYSSEGPFDLILLDIQMPECNGDTAVAEIRRIEQGKKTGEHIPVIALSAKAFQGGGEELIKAGFDEVMAKPISIEELYRVLGKYSV
jgi:CheY-like chemotaxis protein